MTALTIGDYFIGKAKLGYRAVGGTGPYTELFTIEDTVARMNAGAEVFDPSPEFDLGGPVQGFQYLATAGGVEVECSLPQIDAATLGLLLPGSTSTTRPTTTTGGGGSTTTTAAAAKGDRSLALTAVTNFAVGDYIKIDTPTLIEYRRITAINSLVVSFWEPLSLDHASGVAVVEVDGDGKTVITPPTPGRVSSSSYKEFSLIWPRPDASWAELIIKRGLVNVGASPIELTSGSRTMGRVRATIVGYRDPANVEASPFELAR